MRAGKTTSLELADAALARQDRFGDILGTYKSRDPEATRARARAADAALASGDDRGPLQGLPVSAKDLYGVAGFPTFAGTPLELPPEFVREGPLVAGLSAQHAVFVGKTHTVEIAFGGIGRKLGTNPICLRMPSNLDGPILMDMASSTVALGKIALARNRKEEIPVGWIVDKDGNPTTDPNDYYSGGAILPVGADQGHNEGGALGGDRRAGQKERERHAHERRQGRPFLYAVAQGDRLPQGECRAHGEKHDAREQAHMKAGYGQQMSQPGIAYGGENIL